MKKKKHQKKTTKRSKKKEPTLSEVADQIVAEMVANLNNKMK